MLRGACVCLRNPKPLQIAPVLYSVRTTLGWFLASVSLVGEKRVEEQIDGGEKLEASYVKTCLSFTVSHQA